MDRILFDIYLHAKRGLRLNHGTRYIMISFITMPACPRLSTRFVTQNSLIYYPECLSPSYKPYLFWELFFYNLCWKCHQNIPCVFILHYGRFVLSHNSIMGDLPPPPISVFFYFVTSNTSCSPSMSCQMECDAVSRAEVRWLCPGLSLHYSQRPGCKKRKECSANCAQ